MLLPFWHLLLLLTLLYWLFRIIKTQRKILTDNGQKTIPPPKTTSSFVTTPSKKVPVSVNFHFTRKCNYECGFCFHTAKTSYLAPLQDAKRGLQLLASLGMKKLNLSGGEPFLYPNHVGEICKFSKEVLKLESVSIVSNGSKIKESFFRKYGEYLDILAVSVDSFDEDTNVRIGRGRGAHLSTLTQISTWCTTYSIMFKLNTVVNRYNHLEDFTQIIPQLNPTRWKCFQVLPVDTENTGPNSLRDCSQFLISNEEFTNFCSRHEGISSFVPESNEMMKSSYIILDEHLRFLSKGDEYKESRSILEGDVEGALKETDWMPEVFLMRGGVYEWAKEGGGCGEGNNKELEW